MTHILIIKTGNTVQSVPQDSGDFQDWIITATGLAATRFRTVPVHEGQQLPPVETTGGVIITGSPAMVTDRADWSLHTEAFVRQCVERAIPLLGICYGHQLIAQALGGVVDFHPGGREIGTTAITLNPGAGQDPLCRGLPDSVPVHVSHSQTVVDLPPGAQILAASEFEAHHLVRYGEKAWGVQFHPEFDANIMRAYIQDRRTVLTSEGLDPDSLYRQVRETPEAELILVNFASLTRTE